jgi:hypothetical protein
MHSHDRTRQKRFVYLGAYALILVSLILWGIYLAQHKP